jgi:hypothetical protein
MLNLMLLMMAVVVLAGIYVRVKEWDDRHEAPPTY